MTVATASMRSPFTSMYNTKRALPLHYYSAAINYNPQYIEKMAKFHQYTKTTVVDVDNVHAKEEEVVIDEEESSTISVNENNVVVAEKKDIEQRRQQQDIFRSRRFDATDETLEQFWTIQPANPIHDDDDDDESLEYDDEE